jgi:glutamate/tyrosine decarboxylase-like PLP-dependent enzyme
VYLLTKVFFNFKEYKTVTLQFFFKLLRKVPLVQSTIDKELDKNFQGIRNGFEQTKHQFTKIPEHGISPAEVLSMMRDAQKYDLNKYSHHKLSGTIYLGDDAHTAFTNEAYGLFSLSNPLHASEFPNVRRYESEIVMMTAKMLNGGPNVVGAMTSGGTESILMAIKSYRDWARDKKGITKPELVVPITAHAAFDKGCSYFGVKIVHVDMGADFKVDLNKLKRAINKNTIAIVGSAPNFPHGIIDDIEELAKIARAHKIGLHVDGCLGGFVLPFIAKLGKYAKDIPPFDFRVAGVTSMSADTHKYGYAPKGTSVVLFHNAELRNYMFFSHPDWTGGPYGSPTMAGSRPGGLSAAAWASLVAIGESGYLKYADGIMEASRTMLDAIRSIPQLKVVGDPKAMVIAFASDKINVFQVSAAMEKRGWALNSLQYPASVHLCVTARLIGTGPQFAQDIRDSVKEVVEHPEMYAKSSIAMYGSAAAIPDRTVVRDVITGFLGLMLDV